MNGFKSKKFTWAKERVQKETAKYKRWQEYIEIVEKQLLDPDNLDAIMETFPDLLLKKGDCFMSIKT